RHEDLLPPDHRLRMSVAGKLDPPVVVGLGEGRRDALRIAYARAVRPAEAGPLLGLRPRAHRETQSDEDGHETKREPCRATHDGVLPLTFVGEKNDTGAGTEGSTCGSGDGALFRLLSRPRLSCWGVVSTLLDLEGGPRRARVRRAEEHDPSEAPSRGDGLALSSDPKPNLPSARVRGLLDGERLGEKPRDDALREPRIDLGDRPEPLDPASVAVAERVDPEGAGVARRGEHPTRDLDRPRDALALFRAKARRALRPRRPLDPSEPSARIGDQTVDPDGLDA